LVNGKWKRRAADLDQPKVPNPIYLLQFNEEIEMALSLNNLRPTKGSTHKKKRRGRGPGSGLGKTAGRGHKGQKSRSGYSRRAGFEGGQMPLQRRLPKRGFTNIFKKKWIEVRLSTLEENFNSGDEITPELLHERSLIKKAKHDLVILGSGEVTKKLNISAHRFTKSAKEKIEKAGGSATVIVRKNTADTLAERKAEKKKEAENKSE